MCDVLIMFLGGLVVHPCLGKYYKVSRQCDSNLEPYLKRYKSRENYLKEVFWPSFSIITTRGCLEITERARYTVIRLRSDDKTSYNERTIEASRPEHYVG